MTSSTQRFSVATFAGGCFWCVEHAFRGVNGVVDVVSGYTGGKMERPTYATVCGGGTGHREAVQVFFDPEQVSYGTLLDTFWKNIDPTDDGGQFADRGEQYTTAIFCHDTQQKKIAERSKKALNDSGRFQKPVATKILLLMKFYPAEEGHQDYARTHPVAYMMYALGSGRERFIQETRMFKKKKRKM